MPFVPLDVDLGVPLANSITVSGSDSTVRWIPLAPVSDDDEDDSFNNYREGSGGKLVNSYQQEDTPSALLNYSSRTVPSGLRDPLNASVMKMGKSAVEFAERQDALTKRALHSVEPIKGDSDLWTVKYAPRTFVDLLSDEAINLQVLQWIKEWDAYTFRARSDTSSVLGQFSKAGTLGDGAIDVGRSIEPPVQRICLITGPPGSGKTTLAHVISRHCGYDPVEINSSIDRTSATLDDFIRFATADFDFSFASRNETKDSSGASTNVIWRPKCLIIDEIDGSTPAFVSGLLKLDIRRPIFGLANDYYAAPIQRLRQADTKIAVFFLPPVRPLSIVARLRTIAELEGYPCLLLRPLLSELVERTGGDIRACLTTLQFILTSTDFLQRSKSLQAAQECLNKCCRRDATMGLFTVLQQVLHRLDRASYEQLLRVTHMDEEATTSDAPCCPLQSLQKEAVKNVPTAFEKHNVVPPGYRYVYGYVLQGRGAFFDVETLTSALQEHYLQQPYRDYMMDSTAATAADFADHDTIVTRAFSAEATSLFTVAQQKALLIAAACFTRCATPMSNGGGGHKFGFPRVQASQANRCNAYRSVLRTEFAESTTLSQRLQHWYPSLPTVDLATDIVPGLLSCLNPSNGVFVKYPLHFTSKASLGPRELQKYFLVARRHADYGLNYRRVTAGPPTDSPLGEENEPFFSLVPPIDLVMSPPQRNKSAGAGLVVRRGRRYASLERRTDVRQVLVADIVQERVKAAHRAVQKTQKRQRPTPQEEGPAKSKKAVNGPKTEATTVLSVRRDFFGCVIENSESSCHASSPTISKNAKEFKESSAPKGIATIHSVKYVFFDGCTNGIRRTARIADLWS